MKTWTYVTGFIFLAGLITITIFKMRHTEMPDYLFYLFCASAAVFFFLFIFTALRVKKQASSFAYLIISLVNFSNMNFVAVHYFTNYIDANILLGRMEEEGINCWLKDENTVTINPIWTQAVGGIKLMVAAGQLERAQEILASINNLKSTQNKCPQCGSKNVELVSTPRKVVNWFSSLIGFFLGDLAVAAHKVNHCFDCGNEFNPMEEAE